MKFEILDLFSEASKVMHMDKSHDAIRSKIQDSVSAQHRKDNADSGSSSYYDTPWVKDVFGGEDSGQVVVSHKGAMTMHDYKQDGNSGYKTSNPRKVKTAYVYDTSNKTESFTMVLDGRELTLAEAKPCMFESGEVLELSEAEAGTGSAKVTLISAGRGSMGWYTEESLKKAVKDGIFDGAQMFLNHQTPEEYRSRPEGDITKQVGKLTGKAEYVEGSGNTLGKVVGMAKIYPEFKPFMKARKDDIGLSVRVGVEPSGKMKDGVPLVENMLYARSVDYVTKAGRGGKIEELYESFRQEAHGGNQPQENELTKEEFQAALQEALKPVNEAIVKHGVALDRLQESNSRAGVERVIDTKLTASGLNPRGQARVKTVVMAGLPLQENGSVDNTKLETALTAAITEEKTYLQESGVRMGAPIVSLFGSVSQESGGKKKTDEELRADSDKLFSESVGSIMGKEKKSA